MIVRRQKRRSTSDRGTRKRGATEAYSPQYVAGTDERARPEMA